MLLACVIYHLEALTEEILVLKYPKVPLFCWILYNHNSPADELREMFKPSEDAGSLIVNIFLTIRKV